MVSVRLRRMRAWAIVGALTVAQSAGISSATASDNEDPQPLTPAKTVALWQIGGMIGTGLKVSPDGRWAAFEMHRADPAADTYEVGWYIVPLDRPGTPIRIGDGGDPTLFNVVRSGTWRAGTPVWASDSRAIYYSKRDRGETQIWRSNIDGGVRQITSADGDIARFALDSEQKMLVFEEMPAREKLAAEGTAQDRAGWRYDPDKSWSFQEARPFTDLAFSGNGQRSILRAQSIESGKIADATATQRTLLGGASSDPRFPANARSRAQGASAWTGWAEPATPDQLGIFPTLRLAARLGRRVTHCRARECTGVFDRLGDEFEDQLRWIGGGKELLFVRREGANFGHRRWYAWNVERNSLRPVLDTGLDTISSCNRVGAGLVCLRETPTRLRHVVRIDPATGAIATLHEPNPELDQFVFGQVERREWRDAQGNETFGALIRPVGYKAGTRYPLVIVGYRPRDLIMGGTGQEIPIQSLAARGYAVLVYNNHDDFTVQGRERDPIKLYTIPWNDDLSTLKIPASLIGAAIDMLDKEGLIDRQRVGLAGFSMGSHNATYALVEGLDLAAVSLAHPPWSSVNYYLTNGKVSRDLNAASGMRPERGTAPWAVKRFGIAEHVDRVRTPILVQTSDFEHISAAETISRAKDEGVDNVEMYVFPGEFHVKWSPAHRLAIYERNIRWFDFWLKGQETGGAPAGEAVGWRAMRDRICAKPPQPRPAYCR